MTTEERGFDESARKSTKSAKFSTGFELLSAFLTPSTQGKTTNFDVSLLEFSNTLDKLSITASKYRFFQN